MRSTSCGVSQRRRVLVVDDYPDAADVTCLLLELLGHECRAVHTGQAALDEATAFDPEIVLVDIGLPDMCGVEVGRELRRRARRPLHLAAVTGWTDEALRRRTYEAGFDQYVVKPTTRSALVSIVNQAALRPPRRTEQFLHA